MWEMIGSVDVTALICRSPLLHMTCPGSHRQQVASWESVCHNPQSTSWYATQCSGGGPAFLLHSRQKQQGQWGGRRQEWDVLTACVAPWFRLLRNVALDFSIFNLSFPKSPTSFLLHCPSWRQLRGIWGQEILESMNRWCVEITATKWLSELLT